MFLELHDTQLLKCQLSAALYITYYNLLFKPVILLIHKQWVTVSGFNSQCGTFFLVCNQLSR